MSKLPDMPGKNLVEDTTKLARTVAVGTGRGALAVGGFFFRRVVGGRDGDKGRDEPGPAATPTEVAAPKPKAAKSKPAKAKAKPRKPKAEKPKAEKPQAAQPKAAKPKVDTGQPPATTDEPPATTGTDAPTVPGAEPGDQRGGKDPHHALNNPVADPDPTEYPDPFDKREDPRDPVDPDEAPFGEEPHPGTGAESTSEPPPAEDPEGGDQARPPRRENLDE